MLDTLIKKLSVILTLCGGIIILIYTTDLKVLFNGEAKEKVEKFKKEAEEKIEAKKEEVQEKVDKVEKKIESNVEKVEDKVKELKKLKLRDLLD